MHLTTNALVLREVNYKESDKILTLLTEAEGKLTVSARGCRKKDSPISSACQLLAWAEFTLYEFKGLWSVKETASERLFEGARADLDKLALASYFAEVTEALAEEGQAEPGLLAVTLNCLHALDKMDLPLAQVKAAYEWRAMALAGYDPREAVGLWERMRAASSGKRQAEWLSTHPADTTRIADIRRWLPEAMQYYRPK